MKYNIFVHKSVEKFLKKHPEIKNTFKEKAKKIHNTDNWHFVDWKKMKGYESDYRLRIGKYRFIATIFKEEILIYFHEADSRGNIY